MGTNPKVVFPAIMIVFMVAACKAIEATPETERVTGIPIPTATKSFTTPRDPSASSYPSNEVPTPSLSPTVISYKQISDVAYIGEDQSTQKLDVYLPLEVKVHYPTLLMMHGGGGNKRDMSAWAEHFVEQNYAVVSISYSDQVPNSYPTPVQDAFCALAWMHANADAYGFDLHHIIALGYSTGGTLAAMLSTVDDPKVFMQDCPHELPEEDSIQAAISLAGTFDYMGAAESSRSPAWLRRFIENYLGAPLDQAPEIWGEASPTTWIDGNESPFLLIHGTKDTTIDPAQSVNFAHALEQAGVDVQLLLIPDADHRQVLLSQRSFQAVDNFLAVHASSPLESAFAGAETVTFTTQDGVRLSGTLLGEGDIAVVFAHQGTYGADQTTWQPFARLLAENGFATLTFDFRGVGQSEGRLKPSKLIYDVNAAIDFLHERGYDKIACVGASMGGTACLRAALDQPLIAVVVFASTKAIGSPTAIQEDELSHLTISKLFLTASGDHSIVVRQTTRMYEVSAEPKELRIFEGKTEHGTDLFNTDVHDELTEILYIFLSELQ